MAQPLTNRSIRALQPVDEDQRPPRMAETLPFAGNNPSHQAFLILQTAFAVLPMVMGLDKFTNLTTDWTGYLAPVFPNLLGISPISFMRGVGVIEIIAGLGVIIRPRIFGYVVAAWLLGIVCNLMILQNHYDVALRDLGLMLGALALGRLSERFDRLGRT